MASISKRVSGAWQNTSYGIRATATDTITILPTTIYGDGTNATVSIKGNTVQAGTPTPDNPIMPQGTGERTGNLFDYQTMSISLVDHYLDATGQEMSWSGWRISDYIPCNGKEFTINKIGGIAPAICLYDENKQFLTGKSYQTGGMSIKIPVTISSDTNAKYIRFSYLTLSDDLTEIIIAEGTTTPSEYIPYGYKIPISSANTTTSVYLGEVQTTRRIRKYEFDGTENWNNMYGVHLFMVQDIFSDTPYIVTAPALCTEYTYNPIQSGLDRGLVNGEFALQRTLDKYNIGFKNESYSTVADFQAYLATQYAAGTPVCVWYVLANEETAVVNEPLMRIGDYADEVSGVSIPTTDGANTLSVDTTVQPSEVGINYHGWHMGTVHERVSSEWD